MITAPANVRLVHSGTIFTSHMQTITNPIACYGVAQDDLPRMFFDRYPDMELDYQRRCYRGQVQPGRPYLWFAPDKWILNFPVKKHHIFPSRKEYIVDGLSYLARHYVEWGITSLAFPALGCGTGGGLSWTFVRPIMELYAGTMTISVEMYQPF